MAIEIGMGGGKKSEGGVGSIFKFFLHGCYGFELRRRRLRSYKSELSVNSLRCMKTIIDEIVQTRLKNRYTITNLFKM